MGTAATEPYATSRRRHATDATHEHVAMRSIGNPLRMAVDKLGFALISPATSVVGNHGRAGKSQGDAGIA